MSHALLPALIRLAHKAGDAIMQVYRGDFAVQRKQDYSPLTEADLVAHGVIAAGLQRLTPGVPLISEECELAPFLERRQWRQYWLVDPLDGTREFVKRNDEFSVNIALIDQGRPVLGVIHAPALGLSYYADGKAAYKQSGSGSAIRIHARTLDFGHITVAVSRSHLNNKVQAMLRNIAKRHGEPDMISMGSSLKICLVAEGRADVYPRLGLTSEWDTAAGQCVLECAGGQVVDRHGLALQYNGKDTILNPEFFARGATAHDWNQYME
ncbi:3'(2'),5'-bisphosphate nucleotidase CysQ [Methylobacillus flagellatus]|uniref:3'(2'),5'-bisphosphate nucleotidase CysQ n=1 Tax=Methylobacillus flagellatus (strain ATCC 51484 / DSM 6875 / VKM B-1610 / KT) TaxID=265072 RepID=Q1H1G5_METFK|nr:3'(2'),5'-bisphosphate nucleotidase CysQ [Methylobacillus flagellatus]ABE49672.1 3'(2'),5'-bisphosphate nucleotidase [Methylobacillus flagellatus KT]